MLLRHSRIATDGLRQMTWLVSSLTRASAYTQHLHRGGYAIDKGGIHHVTLQSPLTFENCFGYIDAYADRLELVGCGEQGIPSRTMRFATAGSVSH